MAKNKPTSFEELDLVELRRSAVEDFAVDITEKDNQKVVLAALLESGVKWADYVAQHPEVAAVVEAPANVVTAPNVPGESTVEPVEQGEIIVAQPVQPKAADQFLIKMTRDNPLFVTRGYKFTKEHPYALVKAKDVEYILQHEDGFRQAFPSELAEFYG